MDGISLLLLTGADNPETRKAVAGYRSELEKLKRPFEIVVLPTMATTAPLEMPAPAGVQIAEPATAVGLAWSTGFALAKQPLIATASLAYPHRPSDLGLLLKSLDQPLEQPQLRVDFVNGCRLDTLKSPRQLQREKLMGFCRRLSFGSWPERHTRRAAQVSSLENLRLRLQFGLRFQDPYSDMKLFRRSVLERVPLQSRTRFVWPELLGKLTFLGHLMDEVAIAERPGPYAVQAVITEDRREFRQDRRNVFFRPRFGKPKTEAPPVTTAEPATL
jgi:hypothetical protein